MPNVKHRGTSSSWAPLTWALNVYSSELTVTTDNTMVYHTTVLWDVRFRCVCVCVWVCAQCCQNKRAVNDITSIYVGALRTSQGSLQWFRGPNKKGKWFIILMFPSTSNTGWMFDQSRGFSHLRCESRRGVWGLVCVRSDPGCERGLNHWLDMMDTHKHWILWVHPGLDTQLSNQRPSLCPSSVTWSNVQRALELRGLILSSARQQVDFVVYSSDRLDFDRRSKPSSPT